MRFIDTNIFIRFLTNDDPAKGQACRALFESASRGDVELLTSEAVIAEVVYVLSSKRLYGVPRDQVRAVLYPLLTIQGLRLISRKTFLRALDLFAASNLDYEDALTIAHMERQRITDLVSYDQGFDRVSAGAITRSEP